MRARPRENTGPTFRLWYTTSWRTRPSSIEKRSVSRLRFNLPPVSPFIGVARIQRWYAQVGP